jgi:hypothetical protein
MCGDQYLGLDRRENRFAKAVEKSVSGSAS